MKAKNDFLVNEIFTIFQNDFGDAENDVQLRLLLDANEEKCKTSCGHWEIITFGVLKRLRREGKMPRPRIQILMIQLQQVVYKIKKRFVPFSKNVFGSEIIHSFTGDMI
jgi:hypothetical protein